MNAKKLIFRSLGLYMNTLALVAPKVVGKIGFRLFCTPRPSPVKSYHQKFFEASEMGSFESEHYRIQTYKWGHGPIKVLMLHGWQSHSFRWKHYVELFPRDQFTLYAMDAPAHGLSSGKTFTVISYSNAIEKYLSLIGPVDAIMAHSLGGFAAMHSLYNHPHLPVGKLVLMGVPGEVSEFFVGMKNLLKLSDRTMKAIKAAFERMIQKPLSFFSSRRFATKLTIPGLIVHDEGDLEASYRYAIAIHEIWKNSHLITTTGLGHHLKAKDVVRQVEEYLLSGPQ